MLLDTISEILSSQLGLDAVKDFTPDTSFDELGFNEFDMVELAMAIESEFDVELTDEQIADLESIEDLINLIEGQ